MQAANCKRVRALRVFEAALRSCGYDPATANPQPSEKARFADIASAALRTAWRFTDWPFLLESRRFFFRPFWDAQKAYTEGDEVWWAAGKIYLRAGKDLAAGADPADRALWRPACGMVRGVGFAENGIDGVNLKFGATAQDQRLVQDPLRYTLRRTGPGVAVADAEPDFVWLLFRPEPPELSWTDWDAAAGCAPGETAFCAGESWMWRGEDIAPAEAAPGQDARWRRQDTPLDFLDYITAVCALTRLTGDDAQIATERARAATAARDLLEELKTQLCDADNPGSRAAIRVSC
jgi:hypothetical protein